MAEEENHAAAQDEWDNDIGPTWKQKNFRKIFEPDTVIVGGKKKRSKCYHLANTVDRVHFLEKNIKDDVTFTLTELEESGSLNNDYEDAFKKSGFSKKTFIQYAWNLEERNTDGTVQDSCSTRLKKAYADARSEFLSKNTLQKEVTEAAGTAASDVVRCARGLVTKASVLPDLIDKFKLYSVDLRLYIDASAMERAIAQENSVPFSVDLPAVLKTLSEGTGSLAGYMSNASVMATLPPSESLAPQSVLSTQTPLYDANVVPAAPARPARPVANYSNLIVHPLGQVYTYPEIPTGVPSGSSFPWYYAGLATAVVRIAIKLEKAISAKTKSLTELTALVGEGQDINLINQIMEFNHGNGITGNNTEQQTLDKSSPYAILVAGNVDESPKNSTIRFLDSSSGFKPEALKDGDKQYALPQYCQIVIDAARQMQSFYAGEEARLIGSVIIQFATELRNLSTTMRDLSQCIFDADEAFTDKIKKANKEFQTGNKEEPGFLDYLLGDALQINLNNASIENNNLDPANTDLNDLGLDSISERALFREQCFLLSYIAYFVDYKKNTLDYYDSSIPSKEIHKRLPYASLVSKGITGISQESGSASNQYNSCLQVDGDPYGFINKLTQNPSYGTMFDIDPWHMAALQPKIRLFKVIYDQTESGETREREVEISFESHFSGKEMNFFKNKRSRGAGVGLKSFEFTYDGSNPFSAKKSIKANLKIFSSTFSELTQERIGDTTYEEEGKLKLGKAKYAYTDLALKTSTSQKKSGEYDEWKAIVDENEKLAKLNFRLKAVIGLSLPKGDIPDDEASSYTKRQLKDALAQSYVTLNLTPTVHDFEFDEQGRVSLNIRYLAYVEDFFDQSGFNVFADPSGIHSFRREKRKLQMKALRAACDDLEGDDNKKSLQTLQKEYVKQVDTEIGESVQSMIRVLMNKKRIYYMSLSTDQINKFTALGPHLDFVGDVLKDENGESVSITSGTAHSEVLQSNIEKAMGVATLVRDDPDKAEERAGGDQNPVAAALAATNPLYQELAFFYVSDLIDTVLENIQKDFAAVIGKLEDPDNQPVKYIEPAELKKRKLDLMKYQKNFERFRILLGPVEFVDHGNYIEETSIFVNFGDIPISVKYFVEWLADRALSREDSFYSLTRFMNDLFNNLITKFLNNGKCFAFSTKQKVRVNQNVLTSYNDTKSRDEITDKIIKHAIKLEKKNRSGYPARLTNINKLPLPILNISGKKESNYAPLSKETNYFVFFAGRVQPVEKMNGNKAEDSKNGIYHYLLGRDKGLVKNISLKKTETPGLQEVRFEQEGYEGLEQLRVVYDADITCHANVNTFPGTYIYLPPRGFDPSAVSEDLTKYGIGGYYMIIKSTHKFGPAMAESTIYAKWVAQLETNYPVENSGKVGKRSSSPGTCKSAHERLEALGKEK